MLKVQLSNRRCNSPENDPTYDTYEHTHCEAENVTTGRDPTASTYFDWCYRSGADWILWCLVSNTSKEQDQKTNEVGARPPRVDSGVGLCLLADDVSRVFDPTAATPPTQITLTFRFPDSTYIKTIDYAIYSTWSAINTLLSALERDGITVHTLWDVHEDMPIGSGDWNARIQPGSVIVVWCFNDARGSGCIDGYDSSDCESDDEMLESDEDGHDTESEYKMSWKSSSENTRNEHTWWLTRWRQRVENTIPGRGGVTDEPSCFFIVVWCTTTITITALLVLLNQ